MADFALCATTLVAADEPHPLPDAEAVRRTARQVLARPEFQIDGSTEAGESLWALLHRLFAEIIGGLRSFFEFLYRMSPVLAWLFIAVLVLIVSVLLGHIIWTMFMFLRRGRRRGLAEDPFAALELSSAEFAHQAETARAQGDYILGVRLLFRACLAHLEQREGKRFRPGATNREHLNRYRQSPLYDWLARIVWVIDSKWYGQGACLPADFAECREAYERICSLAARRDHAQHA
jgi:hypothetical protein